MITIHKLNKEHFTPALTHAFQRLMSRLKGEPISFTSQDMKELLEAPCTYVFVAVDDSRMGAARFVGTATATVTRIPTGWKAWVEDVVVDEAYERQGWGEKLTRHALDVSQRLGAQKAQLTSNASRKAAHQLYTRMGFVPYDTTVFRIELKGEI